MFAPATHRIWKGAAMAAALMLVMAGPALAAKEGVPASALPSAQTEPPLPPAMPPMPPPPPMPSSPMPSPGMHPAEGAHSAMEAALKECGDSVKKDKKGHPQRKAMDECLKKKGALPPHAAGKR